MRTAGVGANRSTIDGNTDADALLLSNEEPEKAAEYCRLALQHMQQHDAALVPLNYALFYCYVSGRDQSFNEKLDAVLRSENRWHHDSATRLFLRYLSPCNDISIAALQEDLQSVLHEVIDSTRGAAEGVDQHSARINEQVAYLEKCDDPKTASKLVARIMQETRSITQASKSLSEKMHASIESVEKLNEELARARHDATTDSLTGVGNRARLDKEMDRMLRNREPFSLIMMDIDHFKSINDRHGHLIGDRVLYQLAMILSSRTRSTDIVTRYGGEEFAILLPETRLGNCQLVAEKLRSSIQHLNMRRTDTGADIGEVTASFGVAEHHTDETALELISRADDALYRAKTSGRNRIVLAEHL